MSNIIFDSSELFFQALVPLYLQSYKHLGEVNVMT